MLFFYMCTLISHCANLQSDRMAYRYLHAVFPVMWFRHLCSCCCARLLRSRSHRPDKYNFGLRVFQFTLLFQSLYVALVFLVLHLVVWNKNIPDSSRIYYLFHRFCLPIGARSGCSYPRFISLSCMRRASYRATHLCGTAGTACLRATPRLHSFDSSMHR